MHELTSRVGEEYVQDAHRFWRIIDQEKMVHVVTDGGANPNPGSAGWGAMFRQNKRFTMMWKHFDHATNNTMELREAAEALKYHPAGMNVWITTDLQYARKGSSERCARAPARFGDRPTCTG
jgi:ribonuclease HI